MCKLSTEYNSKGRDCVPDLCGTKSLHGMEVFLRTFSVLLR